MNMHSDMGARRFWRDFRQVYTGPTLEAVQAMRSGRPATFDKHVAPLKSEAFADFVRLVMRDGCLPSDMVVLWSWPEAMTDRGKTIIREACAEYRVPLPLFYTRRRTRALVDIRYEVAKRLKTEIPTLSIARIGRWLQRDHTTILYALRRWKP